MAPSKGTLSAVALCFPPVLSRFTSPRIILFFTQSYMQSSYVAYRENDFWFALIFCARHSLQQLFPSMTLPQQIYDELSFLQQREKVVSLCWVLGYVGMQRNEEADWAADHTISVLRFCGFAHLWLSC